MNPDVLETILRCDKLPSLPAVALRVIELTSRSDTSMNVLAETIQHDQALTAKILRTVNSSIFGLRRKCASINQAIVMLGLNTVKTLALGFTLVGAIEKATSSDKRPAGAGQNGQDGFNMAAHWRRSLDTAAAARAIANLASLPSPEECFLGGLLQDVGMVAMHLALGDEYARIIAQAAGSHAAVTRLELAALSTQHADIGAMLASRWKLPDELVMPIKYHERPTAAPAAHQGACRAVALGNLATDVLIGPDAVESLRRLHDLAARWFSLGPDGIDQVLLTVSEHAREMASLLKVPIAPAGDAAALVAAARARLAELDAVGGPIPSVSSLDGEHTEGIDELTGAFTRRRFEQTIVAAFEQAREVGGGLSLAFIDIDGLDTLTARHGTDVRDTVIIVVAGRIEQAYSPARPLVCRYTDDRFAVLLQKADRPTAVRLTEEARTLIARDPIDIAAGQKGAPPNVRVAARAGLVIIEREDPLSFADAGEFVAAALHALSDAHGAGSAGTHVFAPAALKAA
ncbi:MAG: GGDEF domain-containing protein [Phycisphaerales bacterium]|nr:GGDEF domain-containing protein [Phycisphaerales bacterium]